MADSTTHLDTISSTQAAKEVTANALFAAMSQSSVYGRRELASSGLTWAYYGGVVNVGSTPTTISNGTVSLTGSATNYIRKLDSTGAVSVTTSIPGGWPAPGGGYTALYTVVCGASGPTSWTDHRVGVGIAGTNGSTGSTGATGAAWSLATGSTGVTAYTLQTGDNGKVLEFTASSAVAVTTPSGLGAFVCQLIQSGTGTVSVSAGSGVTLNSFQSLTSLAGQHAAANLVATSADVYNLSGNLA